MHRIIPFNKNVNRKVQEDRQAEVAANPWRQEEEKNKQRPSSSSPSKVIKMLKE